MRIDHTHLTLHILGASQLTDADGEVVQGLLQ
jgi:hypothetical protein